MRKDIDEIKNDIRKAGKMFGNRVEKIFLEDGNAFVVKSDVLIEMNNNDTKQISPAVAG